MHLSWLVAVVLVAGCFGVSEGEPPTPSVSVSSSAAPPPPTSDPPVAAPPGLLEGQALSVRANLTGDLAVRFLLEAPEGTPCTVEWAAAFTHEGRSNSFATFEESSGARFTYGGQGTYVRIGTVDTAEAASDDLEAWQSRVTGPSWGQTHYSMGVRNLTWWANDITQDATVRIDASCDGPFQVKDVTASREVRLFSEAGLTGGQAVASDGAAAAAQGSWADQFAGSNVTGVVLSNAQALRMHWTTPTETIDWDGNDGGDGGASLLSFSGPAGEYAVTVDVVGQPSAFSALVADLPRVADLQAWLDAI